MKRIQERYTIVSGWSNHDNEVIEKKPITRYPLSHTFQSIARVQYGHIDMTGRIWWLVGVRPLNQSRSTGWIFPESIRLSSDTLRLSTASLKTPYPHLSPSTIVNGILGTRGPFHKSVLVSYINLQENVYHIRNYLCMLELDNLYKQVRLVWKENICPREINYVRSIFRCYLHFLVILP